MRRDRDVRDLRVFKIERRRISKSYRFPNERCLRTRQIIRSRNDYQLFFRTDDDVRHFSISADHGGGVNLFKKKTSR